MRSIIGLALLLTGLSIGAYAYYPETVQQHVSLAKVTRVIAPVEALQSSVVDERAAAKNQLRAGRGFSPGDRLALAPPQKANPILSEAPKRKLGHGNNSALGNKGLSGASGTGKITTAALPVSRRQGAYTPEMRGAVSNSSWTTVVTPAISSRTGTSAARPLKSSVPADGSAKYALIRDIQRELKRVGCYWGKIDGDWGPGSRRAINGFVKTVNSTLPTRAPDYILLALVRAQNSQVCGVSNDKAIIATAGSRAKTKRVAATRKSWTATVRPVPRPRLIARPKPTKPTTKRVASISPTAPVVVPRPKLVTRPKSQPASGLLAYAPKPALPRRMGIGGPKPSKVRARNTAPGVSALPSTTRARHKKVARRNPNKPTARAPKLAPRPKASVAKKKKRRSRVRVARAKSKKSRRRRSYRRRRGRNPLRNIMTQGVY